MLGASAYEIRALERGERAEEQTYVIRFRERIADGRVAILRLRLSDEAGLDDQTYELRLRTAPPFAATEASCGRGWSDDRAENVLRCASYLTTPESGDEEGDAAAIPYAPASKRRLTLSFNATPETIDILRAREALRITPPVDDLAVETDGRRLRMIAKFLSDQVYELSIAEGALKDAQGRALASAFSQRFAFTRDAPALQWDAGYGVVERFGPQLLPLRGRGYDRADIRIHAIDPLSRDFFPFPAHGVETSDSDAPPLPGNEPKSWSETANIEAEAIKERIKSLGSPAVSRLVDLPIRRNGPDAKFGVDLKEDFAKVSGRDQPGTYLVGLRAVDDDKRRWLRVQITDLSLSAIEEPTRVRFAVTSLSTTQPVSGAQIRVEGDQGRKIRHARERNDRRFRLLLLDARQARRRRSASHRREQGPRHARHRSRQRAIGIFARKSGRSPNRNGSPGRARRTSRAPKSRARSAISSRSGRSIGRKNSCTSRASCAAIAAAR